MADQTFTSALPSALKLGAAAGVRWALFSGGMILAGLGAVCLATILGSSRALMTALAFVLIGAVAGAALRLGLRLAYGREDAPEAENPHSG